MRRRPYPVAAPGSRHRSYAVGLQTFLIATVGCTARRSFRMSQIAPEHRATTFVGAHVDHDTRDQLRALAREEERSISAVIRRALRHELERVNETEDT